MLAIRFTNDQVRAMHEVMPLWRQTFAKILAGDSITPRQEDAASVALATMKKIHAEAAEHLAAIARPEVSGSGRSTVRL